MRMAVVIISVSVPVASVVIIVVRIQSVSATFSRRCTVILLVEIETMGNNQVLVF